MTVPGEGTSPLESATFPHLIQELIDSDIPVGVVDVYKGWMEIDTFDDYRRAWADVETL